MLLNKDTDSLTATAVESPSMLISDPTLTGQRRKLIDLMNRLQDVGYGVQPISRGIPQ